MIRVLIIIAVVGFAVAIATLGGAAAIIGPDIAANGWDSKWAKSFAWTHDDHDGSRHRAGRQREAGPQATREMAWDGSESLDLDVAAEVIFTQAPGPGKLIITGPQAIVNDLTLSGGRLRDPAFRSGHMHDGRVLTIVMTAPKVTRFDASGANRLTIENYRQDTLDIDASGFARITARGETNVVRLDMSGAGDADLGQLKAKSAEVELSGAGKATLAPSDSLKVDISGIGQVTLLTNPATVESDISGAGRIIHAAPGATATTPAPDPGPPVEAKAKTKT